MAKGENSSISLEENSSSELRPWQSYHTVYTNAKAGMDGVDKEKVQRVVYEMSKGSKYFKNEERKEAYMKQKIDSMRAQCEKLASVDVTHFQKVADKRIIELEATRDLSRIWLHVDMDAFYAAVETLCDPTLKGKPIAVGSLSMISTANYEARKFGVRAAMPGFIARKLCPELTFVPVDFKKYTHYSNLTRQVFQKYDPNFLAMSLDEAYLDITNVCTERGITGEEVAQELRETVHSETGLTCSAGVAPNRLLAKVCSDINKPNGQFVLPNERSAVMTFISSLPIRKIGGIGKVTEHILKDVLGITTCEEMLQKSGLLCALFSRSSAEFFLSAGLGLGGTNTPEVRMRKSISNERTFAATNDEPLLYKKLGLRMSHFNEERNGAPTGSTQKTLSDFVYSNASGRKTGGHTQLGSCCSDDVLSVDYETCLSSENRETCVSKKSVDDGQPSDLNHGDCLFTHNSEPEDEGLGHHSDAPAVNKIDGNAGGLPLVSRGGGNSQMAMDYPCRKQSEESSPRNGKSWITNPDLDAGCSPSHRKEPSPGSSSSSKDPFFWVDNYKCSLCGIELPPNFTEERQEHSDFHLAERLQEEESHENSKSILKQRSAQKDHAATPNRPRKKNKSSPAGSKHLPIDEKGPAGD